MKFFGYAACDGAYSPPGKLAEVTGWTNMYVAWAFLGYFKNPGEAASVWLARMAICVKRAAGLGMHIYLGLDTGRNPESASSARINAVLDVMAPYWDSVVCIDIADEPSWNNRQTKDMLAKVRSLVAAKKLGYRPCGITYTATQSVTESPITIPLMSGGRRLGPEFTVLELYSTPQNMGQDQNLAFVKNNIKAAVSRIDPAHQLGFWTAGYDRNGAFVGQADIAALNLQAYQFVRDTYGARAQYLPIFSWARMVGKPTRAMPLVQAAHRKIWQDLGARAAVRQSIQAVQDEARKR